MKNKFRVGDILAWPDWEKYVALGILPEVIKITAVEHYGAITQYRYTNLVSLLFHLKGPANWKCKSISDFFHNDSIMEKGLVNIRIPLLIKYGVY